MAYFLTTRNLRLGWWSCLRKSVIKSSSDFLFYTSLWVWFSSLQLKNAGSTSKPQGYDPGKKKRSKGKGQKKTVSWQNLSLFIRKKVIIFSEVLPNIH